MCLLTFLPGGVQPDVEALHHGAAINRDGHGYAIVTASGLLVRHSLHADGLIEEFAAARRMLPDGDALFHSRLATAGSLGLDNCHPFRIGGDRRTVLAHNGILPMLVPRTEPRSDTRILAEDGIPAIGSLRSRQTRRRLARWMGTDNKMVILSVDRRFRSTAYLLNEQAGEWSGGIWYSNPGYLPWPWPEPDLEDDRDPLTCIDCGAPPGCCLCWRPLDHT